MNQTIGIAPAARRRLRVRLGGDAVTRVSLFFLAAIALAAIFAPLLAPFDPNKVDLLAVYKSPTSDHLLGTDSLGRDLLSRLIFGARTSAIAAIEAVGVSVAIGVPLGLIAGYAGGWIDAVLGRINDAVMSVPNLIFALALVAVLGPGLGYAMLAIGIAFTPRVFRVTRALALEVRHTTFIEASESIGCSRKRILFVHVLPNILGPLMVVITVSFGTAILAEATLSFLGLGARPPAASWGGMIAQARQRTDLPYLVFPPGLALLVTVVAFTFLGDSLRESISGVREETR